MLSRFVRGPGRRRCSMHSGAHADRRYDYRRRVRTAPLGACRGVRDAHARGSLVVWRCSSRSVLMLRSIDGSLPSCEYSLLCLALSFGVRDLPFGYVVGVAVCYRDSFGALVGTVARCRRLRMLLGSTNSNAELVQLLCVLIMELEVVHAVEIGRGAGTVVQVSGRTKQSRKVRPGTLLHNSLVIAVTVRLQINSPAPFLLRMPVMRACVVFSGLTACAAHEWAALKHRSSMDLTDARFRNGPPSASGIAASNDMSALTATSPAFLLCISRVKRSLAFRCARNRSSHISYAPRVANLASSAACARSITP
jgi:hypothetical protein